MGASHSIRRRKETRSKVYISATANPTSLKSYQLGDILQMGSFGTLQTAEFKSTGTSMVLRKIKLKEYDQDIAVNSYLATTSVLRRLGRFAHLPSLLVAFSEGTSLYIGTEHAIGGNLRYHLKNSDNLSTEQIAYIIYSVGSALRHVHEHNIVHRDVKPENIALKASGCPMLTFGMSFCEGSDNIPISRSCAGTQQYLAPEVLTPSHRHSFQSDFWSLGVVAYELLFEKLPFTTHCSQSMIFFVENHYHLMWDRVEVENVSEYDSRAYYKSGVDWDGLADYCESDRIKAMRYSHHDIQLLEDGSVPCSLRVEVPSTTAAGDATSPECIDLLNGLMDVRIPKRLGVGAQYEAFQQHDFFVLSDVECMCSGGDSNSARFVPDVQKVTEHLRAKNAQLNFIESASIVKKGHEVRLTDRNHRKLNASVYVCPEMGGHVIPTLSTGYSTSDSIENHN